MKRLLILSGKGGTGKTTTAAAFVRFSNARAVADCDVDAPNLHLVSSFREEGEKIVFYGSDKANIDTERCKGCGLCKEKCRFGAIEEDAGMYRVNEFTCEGCGVCAYVCPQNAVTLTADAAGVRKLVLEDGVFSTATLKMGRGNSGKLVTDVKMAMLKNAKDAALAIVDGSPGIGCPVTASISGMDMILVVAEPSRSGISDLERLVKTAELLQAKLCVCVNKWDVNPKLTEAIIGFCTERAIPFVGKIPYDKMAGEAINSGISLAETDCPARDALFNVYHNTMQLLEQ